MLVNPTNPENNVDLKYVQEAAHTIGQSILVLGASKIPISGGLRYLGRTPSESASGWERRGSGVLTNSHRQQIVALAARHTLPASYPHYASSPTRAA